MIARLWGVIEETGPESVIIRAGSVGYRVLLSPYALGVLSGADGSVSLRTFLVWGEHQETPLLVGFVDPSEEDLFHEIRRIGGVGATKAIRMISLSPQDIWQAVSEGNLPRLKTLKGVGDTTAKKLISELRDRIPSSIPLVRPDFPQTPFPHPSGGVNSPGVAGTVHEILTHQFGHSPAEADQMIRRALSRNPAVTSVEELFDEVYRHGVD